MEMIIVLLVAAGLIAFAVMRSRSWKTLQTGNGSTADDIQAKYAFLKSNNVKCKLKTEAGAEMGAMHGMDAGGNYIIRLNVHTRDIDRAATLLEQYEKEQLYT